MSKLRRTLHPTIFGSVLFTLVAAASAVAQKSANSDPSKPFEAASATVTRPANPPDAVADPPALPSPSPAVTPMSANQKLSFGLRAAFANPGSYAGPAIGAYITERREVK